MTGARRERDGSETGARRERDGSETGARRERSPSGAQAVPTCPDRRARETFSTRLRGWRPSCCDTQISLSSLRCFLSTCKERTDRAKPSATTSRSHRSKVRCLHLKEGDVQEKRNSQRLVKLATFFRPRPFARAATFGIEWTKSRMTCCLLSLRAEWQEFTLGVGWMCFKARTRTSYRRPGFECVCVRLRAFACALVSKRFLKNPILISRRMRAVLGEKPVTCTLPVAHCATVSRWYVATRVSDRQARKKG